MGAGEWGYNAREHSDDYLAVEFAQPTADYTITDGQIAAFIWWYKTVAVVRWPHLKTLTPEMLPLHSELAAGIRDGKSDAYPRGDSRADQLRQRIIDGVNGA